MPLAYALVAIIGLVLLLTWGALQVQVTLAGFLNSESIWSKAQKQAVIDLDNYAIAGDPASFASFTRDYSLLESDRMARDAIVSGHFDKAEVNQAFVRGNVMPTAKAGMIFLLRYFHLSPHMHKAMQAWRSTDQSIDQLHAIATELQHSYVDGSVTRDQIGAQRARIDKLNRAIQPQADLFSLEIALGAVWLGHMLFYAVLLAAGIAVLLWLRMARRIFASVRGTEERYRLLFDSAADAIVMVDDASGRILDANRMASAWTGRSAGDLVGDRFDRLFMRSVSHLTDRPDSNTLLDAAGGTRPVETHSSLATWADRPVRQAIIRDITERVEMEQERRIAAEALSSIAEGVIIADADRMVVSTNAAHAEITGFSAQDLRDRRIDDTRSLSDGSPMPQAIWDDIAAGRNWLGEVLSMRRDGTSYPEHLSISAIRDAENQVLYYVAVFTNIFASKVNQRRLEYLARHDPLTGLVNRAEFERQCDEAIAGVGRDRQAAAVLFIDLDAFKLVNDSYSHAIGDRVLVRVGERIQRQLSGTDVAGRIGGDEFTVLIGRMNLREDAITVARRLLAALSEPFSVDEYEIVMSASIGIAGYPLDGDTAVTLIANADAAMYVAKTEERNTFRFYTPLMHANTSRRLLLATELRHALASDQLRLVYQPSVDLRTGRIVAVEALLRWRHPGRGEVMPAEFIPVAESLGLIRRIDEWVLKTACAQIEAWDSAGVPPIRVAVNVSARWFGHPAFVEGLERVLHSTQLSASRLMLEITEGAMLKLGDETERTMRALHALGIEVAIDDFGTGYSSMAYLKLPAVSYLKIDRSFVTGLPASANDVAIAKAMLAMAKSLGLSTIAEGIETEGQHEFLLREGCIEGQGYLYAYPIEAGEIKLLLCPAHPHAPSKLRLVPTSPRF
ncbi:MAG: EAL domain-containing protein [Pseudomonadota bacterium]|nr:EAL domain-containing protein [Pseudomonadota bacterium]